MTKLTVLIVDDDREWCSILRNQLENYSFLTIEPPVYDGETALEHIQCHRPDILILDLVLPHYDGLYLVSYIRDQMPGYTPFIYILSAIGTEKTNRVLRNLEVSYYSIKPINTVTVANNLYRLLFHEEAFRRIYPQDGAETEENDPCQVFDYPQTQNLDWIIEDYLYELGVSLSLLSTKCTRLAIEICLNKDPSWKSSITDVYRRVAQVFDPPISPLAVERNIRTTVSRIKREQRPLFAKHFLSDTKLPKINNSAFLFTSAHIIQQKLEEQKEANHPQRIQKDP